MRESTTLSGFRLLGSLRRAGLFGLVLLMLSCGREITAPVGALSVSAPMALLTQFPALPGQAALRSGVAFERLRATIYRLDGSVAIDRVSSFPSSADSVNFSLSVSFGPAATDEGEEMVLLLRFITATGDTVFRSGPDTVFVETARPGAATVVVVSPVYVGPGAEATRVVLSQALVTVAGTAGTTFTAQAFDAQDSPVPSAPILFSSDDTTLVKFANARSGVATTFSRRDSTLVFATLLGGASDTARVRVTPPASAIALLSGDAQSGTVNTMLPSAVSVRVTAADALGVPGVPVTFVAGAGVVGAAAVLTDANGEASTTWTLGSSAGIQSLTASASGLSGSPVTFTATALSAAAVSLQITSQPASAIAGTSLGSIAVTALDAALNPATTFTDSITLSIGANAGGGVLSGTRTVAAINGVATFAGLSIDRSGTGYTLVASGSGLSSATSTTFNITPAAAASLAFVVQPSTIAVNATLSPPVQVEAQDAFGNRATDFVGSVTVALASNPGAASLGGTLSVPASAGVATFADLTVDAIAAGYTLAATASGLTDATSTPFNTLAELNAWATASSGNWSAPSNWSLGRVPVATDSVVIAVPGTYTVTLDVDFVGSHLALGGGVGTQTLSASGRTLTLDGSLRIESAGELNALNSTFDGAGTAHNVGSLLLREVTFALPLANGGLVVANGSTDFTAAVTTNGSSVIRAQPDGSTGISVLSLLGGISNFGLLELTSVGSAYASSVVVSGGSLVNAPGGILRAAVGAGGTRTLTAQVQNAGSIVIDQPTTWNGVSAVQQNTGNITLNANLTLAQSGTAPSFNNNGSIDIPASRSLTISGGGFSEAGVGTTGAGTLAFENATVQFLGAFTTGGLALTAVNSSLTGGGSLGNTVGRTMSLRGSNIVLPFTNAGLVLLDGNNSFGSSVTTLPGSTIRVEGTGATGIATLSTPGFTNVAAIELSASGSAYSAQLTVTSGLLINAPSGSITTVVGPGGPRTIAGSVDNQGSIVVLQPLTWQSTNTLVSNSGTLDVSGNVTFNQTGSALFSTTGTVNIAAGRALVFNGGSIAQDGGAFTGTGSLSIFAATITGAGAFVNPATRSALLRGVTVSAPLINAGTLEVDGSNSFQGGFTAPENSVLRIVASGATGNSQLTVASGFLNEGSIELSATTSTYSASLTVSSGTLQNEPTGVIASEVGSGGPRTLTAAVYNLGLIDVNHPLVWNGVSAVQTNDGSILADANLSIVQSGTTPSFSNLGSISVAATRTFALSGGSFTQSAGGIGGTGTLSFSDASVVFLSPFASAGLNLSLLNSIVSGSGTLTNSAGRTLAMRGSSLTIPFVNEGLLTADGSNSITGAVTAPVGSIIRVMPTGATGTSTLALPGFTNEGAIELTSSASSYSAQLNIVGGTLVNAASGTLSSLVGTAGPRGMSGSVDNQGSIVVSHPLTWTAANANITNSGSLSVAGGNLSIVQSGSALFSLSGGSIDIAAGRALTIDGASFTQSAGAFTGTGALNFSNLTVTGPGTLLNPATRVLNLRNTTVSAPFDNAGLTVVHSSSSITGALTTAAGSTIRIASDGSVGTSTLTVASGFTNNGAIELSSTSSSYSAGLTVTSGTLVNAAGGSIASLVGTSGPRTLDAAVQNDGVITVLQPLTWVANNVANTINGLLDLTGGNLTLNQTGSAALTVAGTVNIATGRTLTINGGALTQTTGGFTGDGPLLLTDATIAGPGTFTNPAARTLTLRNTTVAAPFLNLGTLDVRVSSSITGALTTASTSLVRIGHDGSSGNVVLSIANGFTNNGAIQLTSDLSSYTSGLTLGSGTLVNAPSGSISTLVGAGGPRNIVAQIDNSGTMSIQQAATWTATNIANQNNGTLDLVGGNLTINQTGTGSFTSDGNINIGAGRVFRVSGGTFEQTGGGFSGTGEFDLQDGTIIGAFFELPSGAAMRLRNATVSADFSNFGTAWVATNSTINGQLSNGAGSTLRVASDGSVGSTTLTLANGFANAGVVELSATSSAYASALNLGSGTLTNGAGGVLSVRRATGGGRSIVGNVNNQGQLSMNGDGASILAITGAFTNSGSIALELGGLTPGSGHDQITVSGLATLGGSLDVSLFGAYVPASGNSFTLITGGLPLVGLFSGSTIAPPLAANPLYLLSSVTVSVP